MFGCKTLLLLLSSLAFLIAPCGTFAQLLNAREFESSELLRASAILSSELYQNIPVKEDSIYAIDEDVSVDGFLYKFVVRTKYGDYDVPSLWLLHKRIAEIRALHELEEYSNSRVLTEAIGQETVDLITGPVRAVISLSNAVIDPSETLETISSVPSGIVGLFYIVGDRIQSGTRSVARFLGLSDRVAATAPVPEQSSETPDPDKPAPQNAAQALTKQGTKEGLRHIGYNFKESQWYKKFNLDPNSTNEQLREKISTIAGIQTGTRFGFRFVPGLGGIALVGNANKLLNNASRIAVYSDPKKQRDYNEKLLESMNISKQDRDTFLSHPALTGTIRTLYIDALQKLEIPHREYLITVINEAESEEEGVSYLRSVTAMSLLMKSNVPADSVVFESEIPAVRTKEGSIFMYLAVDRVSWNEKFAEWISSFLAKEDGTKVPITLFVTGTLSPKAQSKLAERSIKFQELVPMPLWR